jgi:hypothetical protein
LVVCKISWCLLCDFLRKVFLLIWKDCFRWDLLLWFKNDLFLGILLLRLFFLNDMFFRWRDVIINILILIDKLYLIFIFKDIWSNGCSFKSINIFWFLFSSLLGPSILFRFFLLIFHCDYYSTISYLLPIIIIIAKW